MCECNLAQKFTLYIYPLGRYLTFSGRVMTTVLSFRAGLVVSPLCAWHDR